jgi:hypothetical protein
VGEPAGQACQQVLHLSAVSQLHCIAAAPDQQVLKHLLGNDAEEKNEAAKARGGVGWGGGYFTRVWCRVVWCGVGWGVLYLDKPSSCSRHHNQTHQTPC